MNVVFFLFVISIITIKYITSKFKNCLMATRQILNSMKLQLSGYQIRNIVTFVQQQPKLFRTTSNFSYFHFAHELSAFFGFAYTASCLMMLSARYCCQCCQCSKNISNVVQLWRMSQQNPRGFMIVWAFVDTRQILITDLLR